MDRGKAEQSHKGILTRRIFWELVRFLFGTYGFKAHRKRKFDDTPLRAAIDGHVAMAKLLLQKGAKVNTGEITRKCMMPLSGINLRQH